MATSSLEEKWEHPDRSAQDEEDQDQEEEESLSLCDLPVNMVKGENNQSTRDQEAHKETEKIKRISTLVPSGVVMALFLTNQTCVQLMIYSFKAKFSLFVSQLAQKVVLTSSRMIPA